MAVLARTASIFRCLTECREEYRYNLEAVDALIRAHLVNMQQYDLHLAQAMENGLNYMTVHFAMQVCDNCCNTFKKFIRGVKNV